MFSSVPFGHKAVTGGDTAAEPPRPTERRDPASCGTPVGVHACLRAVSLVPTPMMPSRVTSLSGNPSVVTVAEARTPALVPGSSGARGTGTRRVAAGAGWPWAAGRLLEWRWRRLRCWSGFRPPPVDGGEEWRDGPHLSAGSRCGSRVARVLPATVRTVLCLSSCPHLLEPACGPSSFPAGPAGVTPGSGEGHLPAAGVHAEGTALGVGAAGRPGEEAAGPWLRGSLARSHPA